MVEEALSIAVVAKKHRFYPGPHPVISCLEKAGHRVTQVADSAAQLHDHDALLITGSARPQLPMLRELKDIRTADKPLVVIWHFDPLPPPQASGLRWPLPTRWEIARILLRRPYAFDVYTNYSHLRMLAKKGLADVLAVSTRGRADFLAERGIQAHFVPLGYSQELGHDMGIPRDVDVLFLGDLLVPQRKRNLKYVRRRGVNVTVRGSFVDPSCWGEERNRLLNRAKISLNFPRFPGEFAGLRMTTAAANKTLVISEPLYNSTPFVEGQHYVAAPVWEMPDAIAYYLSHEEERRQLADQAHRLVTQEMTMERSASLLLKLIRENMHQLK